MPKSKTSLFMSVSNMCNLYNKQLQLYKRLEERLANESEFLQNLNKESLAEEKEKLNSYAEMISDELSNLTDGKIDKLDALAQTIEINKLLENYSSKSSQLEHVAYTEEKTVMQMFKEALCHNAERLSIETFQIENQISSKFESLTGEEFEFDTYASQNYDNNAKEPRKVR